jgi:hypothetical protein
VESKLSKSSDSESEAEEEAGDGEFSKDGLESADDANDIIDDDENDVEDEDMDGSNNEEKDKNSKYWEDIYGRKRDNKGNVVQVRNFAV